MPSWPTILTHVTILTHLTILTHVSRLVKNDKPAAARPLAPHEYHCFISHAWRTAQDQANAIKSRLTHYIPSLRCFLDVDDLLDLTQLESIVNSTDVLVVFLSGSVNFSRAGS